MRLLGSYVFVSSTQFSNVKLFDDVVSISASMHLSAGPGRLDLGAAHFYAVSFSHLFANS